MSFQHTFSLQLVGPAQSFNPAASQFSAGGLAEINELALALALTDEQLDIAFPFGSIVSCFISCSANATLETNDGTTPADTIALTAGIPVYYNTTYGTNPFTADVTGFFLTAAGTGTCSFKTSVLYTT